jgi:VWFA-related protein
MDGDTTAIADFASIGHVFRRDSGVRLNVAGPFFPRWFKESLHPSTIIQVQKGVSSPFRILFLARGLGAKIERVMRQVLILALLGMMALPSLAGRRMSVAQLEQTLNADIAARKPDAEIVRQIRVIELSERLSDPTFDRLSRQFAADSQAGLALRLLADQSSFLDPPASELPNTPAPDAATQQQLLEAAQRFALQTLPRLPNFLATRTTLSFDDSPQEGTKGAYFQRMGLHLVGTSKAEVSVRNEENPSTGPTPAPSQTQGGLVTWGEFGSALLIILSDSSHGKITWSHWEQTSSGRVAVFHYKVPKAVSHYEIVTPVERIQPGLRSIPSAPTGGTIAMASRSTTELVRTRPGYQGSLWVDPTTGTILRVSLVADLSGNSALNRGAIVVEYGRVTIADKTFICPVRSLALSSAPSTVDDTFEGATTEWLNENLFTSYHIFAATSRVLTESDAATSRTPDAKNVGSAAEQAVQQAPIAASPVSEQSSAPIQPQPAPAVPPTTASAEKAEIPQSQMPIVSNAAAVEAKPSANAAPLESPAQPASGSSPAGVLQASPVAQATQTPGSGFTIHVDVNELLVPAVVRDGKGLTVGGLDKGDFRVLDQGKPRAITGFTLENSAATEGSQRTPESGSESSAVAAQPAATRDRYIVLLFDDRHLNLSDIAITQKAATKMLDEPLGAGEYADVLSFMGVNSGITRDRVALKAAIMQLKAHPLHQYDDHDCFSISAYTAQQIVEMRDDQVFRGAVSQAKSCSNLMLTGGENVFENMVLSAANRALAVGQEDARESLNVIENVVRAMAKLPGQRTLILVSPGFFSNSPETMYFKSELLNQAAAANVIISALDARGMVVDTTGADHVMSELAAGTGGTFFDHSNDLEGGFKSLTVPPEFLYLLELSLKGVKPDGAYHQLQVKVDRRGLDVQARKGYVVAKPENAKKQKRTQN